MTDKIEPYAGAAAAASLLHRNTPGPRLPESCRPATQGQGLAVQQARVAMQGDDPAAAWKCGLPLKGNLRLAPIYASTVHAAGALTLAQKQLRIEPEIAFELARSLPARDEPYTEAEIDTAIGQARLALEVLGCRYTEPDVLPHAELLADHLYNNGLVLGPLLPGPDSAPLETPITIRVDGQLTHELDGKHPDGHPRAGLYWLVNFLRENGLGLSAGQHIITGSFAGYIDVPPSGRITIRYGELGEIALDLTALP